MILNTIKKIATIFLLAIALTGCSSSKSPQLLPDGGPTSAQLYSGFSASGNVGITSNNGSNTFNNSDSAYVTDKLYTQNETSESSISAEHVNELRQDFRRVPNPEITGYVYPHFTDGELPVPGYYTVFKVYNKEHYALTGEGYHE